MAAELTGQAFGDWAAAAAAGDDELLRTREVEWRRLLRGASLVAEADVGPDHVAQAARVLGSLSRRRETVLRKFPACVAVSMAGVAATHYQGGHYWPALWEQTQLRDPAGADQVTWGQAFLAATDRLGLAAFPGLPHPFVGPVVMHAGLPTYCLGDWFELLAARLRLDPSLDAETFLAWATEPGHPVRLKSLDVPARRFLFDGGHYALDVVERCLELLDRLGEAIPDTAGIALPARIIEAGRAVAWELDSRAAGLQGGRGAAARRSRPRIALDPYGAGVQVVLPAVSDPPGGVVSWQVATDSETVTVTSRARWAGAPAPKTAHPLPGPVGSVTVSAGGPEHAVELAVIDPASPVLLFGEDGRALPAGLALPRDQVWALHPADRELTASGELAVIAEMPVPFGWEGWQLRLVSLDGARSVTLEDGAARAVQGFARPRLLLGAPAAGLATPAGAPVYAEPPALWLPGDAAAPASWHVQVSPAAGGPPVSSAVVTAAGEHDLWQEVPRPVLGAFRVTVRGPLGRGLRRTLFIAEGASLCCEPDVRVLTAAGLQRATASLEVPAGAQASPGRLEFGPAELSQLTQIRAGGAAEQVEVTPPHVELARAGTARSWTAAPLQLTEDDIAAGVELLIRAPDTAIRADLSVLAGPELVQSVPGHRTGGITRYDLTKASATIARAGQAEVVLPWGGEQMPVATVRPVQLAAGADVCDGALLVYECAQAGGLVAGVYLTRAPWRDPVEVPVGSDGIAPLPPGLDASGPVLVVVQAEDPWAPLDWPAWPSGAAIACDAPGFWAGGDDEETALSAFLAGEGPAPRRPGCLDRLWRVVALADQLTRCGVPAKAVQKCAALLRGQPAAAIDGLAQAGLSPAAAVAALVSAGVAARQSDAASDPRAAEQLWAAIPAAAAVATGPVLSGRILDAAVARCGDVLAALLDGEDDPDAAAGRLTRDTGRMAPLPAVVPPGLLEGGSRVIAARRLFDRRGTPELSRAATEAAAVAGEVMALLASSPRHAALARLVSARSRPAGGWPALPAMSAALAIAARLAARGDQRWQARERQWRDTWAGLARQAPGIVEIDLVLAEVMIAATERAALRPVARPRKPAAPAAVPGPRKAADPPVVPGPRKAAVTGSGGQAVPTPMIFANRKRPPSAPPPASTSSRPA